MNVWAKRNLVVLGVFGPVLILAGVIGLILPAGAQLMSGAVPYDLFHIVAGTTGLALVWARRVRAVAAFNLMFGFVDLYQALAGVVGTFPAALFALRPADHVVHLVLGVPLVMIGARGLAEHQRQNRASEDAVLPSVRH